MRCKGFRRVRMVWCQGDWPMGWWYERKKVEGVRGLLKEVERQRQAEAGKVSRRQLNRTARRIRR